jgi:5-hydroxyisourate hydrolase
MSQITTHILDTSKGKPAKGVNVQLEQKMADQWKLIAQGHTNADGKIPRLMEDNIFLELGIYRLVFDTASYFQSERLQGFYPFVEITFNVSEKVHYHIPLLLNPFGYSTYRGS